MNLGAKELQLFEMLLAAQGKVVSFVKIQEQIWGSEPPSDSSLRTLLYRLRSKLHPSLIQNEFNFGIRLHIHMT
ncbi:MAG: helix-turn-helix domain-containing protein [Epsilonproteobacteria bacterium]|nr:helix-turn-helix domain-containing protein [Campylobacterota bacterium]